jgi:hypothetical protein
MLDPGYLMLDTELHCRSLSWRAGFKVEGQIFGQLARTSNPVAYTLCLGLSISPWCAGAFHIKYLNKLPAITPWKIDIIAFLVDFPLLIPYIPDLIYR